MSRVHAGVLDVAYDERGEGPPLLLVHGGMGSRRLWGEVVDRLVDVRRCVAMDLRGHGETRGGMDVTAFTPKLLRDDLLAFADALGLERFDLLGLSVGGFVAQEVALEAPERVGRLVLADTWMRTEGPRWLGFALEAALLAAGTRPLVALAGQGLAPEVAELARAATAGTSRAAVLRVLRGLVVHDTLDRVQRIRTPTLVVAGEGDVNLGQMRRLAALVPGAELAVLPGVGHNTNLHAPELFAQAVRAFLLDEGDALLGDVVA